MASHTLGIGQFTANNIVAVLGAIPTSNGTYKSIVEIAEHEGADLSPSTVAKWVTKGRKDRAGRGNTALAQFAKEFDDRIRQHCNGDTNRQRELEKAMAILEQLCECGQKKGLTPEGQRAEQCQTCEELERTNRSRRRRNGAAA